MTEVIWRMKFTVPSYGSLILNEADFGDPNDGIEAMKAAMEAGHIQDWELWKITKTTTEELVQEDHR